MTAAFAPVHVTRAHRIRCRHVVALGLVLATALGLALALPQFAGRALALGVVVAGVLMVVALGIADFDEPQTLGRRAATSSVAALRRVAGWTVVDNVSIEQRGVDQIVITPSAVLAVATRHHQSDLSRMSLAAHERAYRDVCSARGAAAWTRSLLHANGLDDVPVTPVLMIWGPGRPDITEGARDVDGVLVVDAENPQLWASRFAIATLSATERAHVVDLVAPLAHQR